MAGSTTGLLWATAEELAANRPRVLSLYRRILRALDGPDVPLGYAARVARKAEARTIFLAASAERSRHNIADLIDAGEHALHLIRTGRIPPVHF